MVRVGTIALLAALSGAVPEAAAQVAPASLAGRPELEVASGPPVRRAISVSNGRAPLRAARAWAGFVAEVGPRWQAMWDDATAVPRRLWGQGIAAPGATASPAAAEAFTRSFLARHVDLLAPGSSMKDLVLVSNRLDDGMRTLGFRQHHQGMEVLGGQVSFRFKNDRLFVIGAEALPAVVARPGRAVGDAQARQLAAAWIGEEAAQVQAGAVTGPLVLPLIGNHRVLGYRTVVAVTVDARQPIGRWSVYLDAATGERVARRQTLMFATATLSYNTPERRPGGTRIDYPAQGASVDTDGSATTSDDTGQFTWSGTSPTLLTTRARGPLVRVHNDSGSDATAMFTVAPDGSQVWGAASDDQVDSQLTTFVHARIVKDYARRFAPSLAFLDEELQATDNIAASCNAFSDGDTINFYNADADCENTGRLPDVIYHEFGHALHMHSIIDGVGVFESALSEGMSDYLSCTIHDEAGMGRGFFYSNTPLRNLDPVGSEKRWPDDVGEAHDTGEIIGGALWDLRKAMIDRYGHDEGISRTDQLYYAALQRASDIPSVYVELLAADDDNGDLSDGTPDSCLIDAAFGPHGLRALAFDMVPLATESPSATGFTVSATIDTIVPACAGNELTSATVEWRLRDDPDTGGELAMAVSGDQYSATIPSQPDGTVVNYKVRIEFGDGSLIRYPANIADPWYEFYVGDVDVIYCTGFEDEDPFANGWTHRLDSGTAQEGADDWAWGPIVDTPGSGDPPAAYEGVNVIGNDLGGADYNGQYQPSKVNSCTSPAFSVGAYSDVRLQYRRWLGVEDAHFDKASIYVNGALGWRNFDSNMGNGSAIQHQDREWRFHDVPLSRFITDGTVRIKFEIDSDGGLEFGGWNIDDFCIVARTSAVCGDGNLAGVEQCDDGADNDDTRPDACRTSCRLPFCGDGVVDDGEVCDDGDALDQGPCNATCSGGPATAGGCCSTGSGNPGEVAGVLLLALLVAGGLRRRRPS